MKVQTREHRARVLGDLNRTQKALELCLVYSLKFVTTTQSYQWKVAARLKYSIQENEEHRKASSTKWIQLLKIKITSSIGSKVSCTLSLILTAFLTKIWNYTPPFRTTRWFLPAKPCAQPKHHTLRVTRRMPSTTLSRRNCTRVRTVLSSHLQPWGPPYHPQGTMENHCNGEICFLCMLLK